MIDVDPLIRTQLDRLQPLPSGSRGDWNDVLGRARSSQDRGQSTRSLRVGLIAVTLLALALGLLVAAPALGFFGAEPTPSWIWPEGVPGDPIDAQDLRGGSVDPAEAVRRFIRSVNGPHEDPVEIDSIRQIVSVGQGQANDMFLAARGHNGDTCLAKLELGGTAFSPFGCLHDPPRHGAPTADEQAAFIAVTQGGHRGSVVDYVTVAGVARSDVGRVELELQNGETSDLPLNRWRGFGYSTTDSRRFPKTLSVYRTWSYLFGHHSKLVAGIPLLRQSVEPSPLCGKGIGPCPKGVKP